jgi:hypothetical protein
VRSRGSTSGRRWRDLSDVVGSRGSTSGRRRCRPHLVRSRGCGNGRSGRHGDVPGVVSNRRDRSAIETVGNWCRRLAVHNGGRLANGKEGSGEENDERAHCERN